MPAEAQAEENVSVEVICSKIHEEKNQSFTEMI